MRGCSCLGGIVVSFSKWIINIMLFNTSIKYKITFQKMCKYPNINDYLPSAFHNNIEVFFYNHNFYTNYKMLINVNYWYRRLLIYILVILSSDATINLNQTNSHYSFYVILFIDIRNGTLFSSYYFFSQIYIYIFYCKYCTLSWWSYGDVLPITTNLMNLSFIQQMYIQYNVVENHSNYNFPFIYHQHTWLLPSTQLGAGVFIW